MRLGVLLGLSSAICVPLAVAAGAVGACGGPAFTGASADGGPTGGGGASSSSGGTTDAVVGSFCALEAGTHTFCDDFDGPPLSTDWSSIDLAGGGTASTDSTRSYSPPNSLESIAPASLGIETRGRVFKTFGTASKVVVAFELWIDATPPKGATGIVSGDSVVGINVGPTYSIGLDLHTDYAGYFEENSPTDGGANTILSSNAMLVATPTLLGVWTQVVIEVDLGSSDALSITIGGKQEISGAPITPPPGQDITVDVGAYSHNLPAPLEAHFDNVTIDITP